MRCLTGVVPRRQRHHLSDFFESAYYHSHHGPERDLPDSGGDLNHGNSLARDFRYDPNLDQNRSISKARYSAPATGLQRNVSLRHPRRKHISLREGQGL